MNSYLIGALLYCLPLAVQQPPKTVWKPTRDIPLNGIAEKVYGHRAYMRLIALYNQLDSMEMAPKGSVIETPPLPELFRNLGLLPRYQQQFEALFFVIEDSPKTMRAYMQLGKNKDLTALALAEANKPNEVLLNSYASMLEKIVSELETLTTNGNTPKHMLARLKEAAKNFRNWAEQKYDGSLRRSKNMDFTEQLLARALANAVAWARE